ncbi:MAG: hypothetical protein BWY02_01800 [bacterium ADurb.Bin157]|jgi:hypothetical protein|nr:MAG: hypothetical protein BWY02_01800 [bacterium ADurb.Bin157]
MLKEFIDFVDSVLPSVSPDFRDGAKEAIAQFEKSKQKITYLSNNPLDELSQGDIISKIPFLYFDNNGKEKLFVSEAMVLSTSCHVDQKANILLMPVLSLEPFNGKDITDLKNNSIFDYMYLPDPLLAEKYINFEYINTYDKNLIFNGIKDGKIQRVASLNQVGYYLFIIKLTVYLMRKEDEITLNQRNSF